MGIGSILWAESVDEIVISWWARHVFLQQDGQPFAPHCLTFLNSLGAILDMHAFDAKPAQETGRVMWFQECVTEGGVRHIPMPGIFRQMVRRWQGQSQTLDCLPEQVLVDERFDS